MEKKQKLIQSIKRIDDILSTFETKDELGVTEISKLAGLNKSTAYNLIATLENLGYLEKDADTNKYRLGMRLFRLGTKVKFNFRSIVRPFMAELSHLFMESVNLALRFDDSVLFLETVESSHVIRMSTKEGNKLPMYCTALGKVIISSMDDLEIQQYLNRIEKVSFTENTIVDVEDFMKQIEFARKHGYIFDKGEYENGYVGVAAPIFDQTGRTTYAISVSGPTHRLSIERLDEIGKKLVETTKEIAKIMGN